MSRLILPRRELLKGAAALAAYAAIEEQARAFTVPATFFKATASVTPIDPSTVSGAVVGFDASNSGSVTQSGGNISQVNDLSGNANHATQSNNSWKPTYNTSGGNQQNGLNSISIVGSQPSFLSLTNNLSWASQQFTAIVVLRKVTTDFAVPFSGGGGVIGAPVWDASNDLYVSGFGSYWKSSAHTAAPNAGGDIITCGAIDASNAVMRFNGAAKTLNAPAGGAQTTYSTLGGCPSWLGWSTMLFFELWVYNSNLSTNTIKGVEKWLQNKWATASLPF